MADTPETRDRPGSGLGGRWRVSLGAERIVRAALSECGIRADGQRSWDIRINDLRFFRRVVLRGSLGLGESYVDRWWDCVDLGEFFSRLLSWRASKWQSGRPALEWSRVLFDAKRRFFNLQRRRQAHAVVDTHYDLPPYLFQQMLGETMAYSCAYWRGAENLDDAQRRKLDLICRKLDLGPSDLVLDLGCGFGSFARYAAEHCGCTVVAVTLSKKQAAFSREFCAGLPVEIHCCDYREFDVYARGRKFDKIASIAMFEAVGHKNYRTYMKVVDSLLKSGGIWLLHTIGDHYCSGDPWTSKYIFPNGEIPSLEQVKATIGDLFRLEDFHHFGPDYSRTLEAWERNFRQAWGRIAAGRADLFDDRFFRRWIYYLGSCRGAFDARNIQLWQLVMSKGHGPVAYQPAR